MNRPVDRGIGQKLLLPGFPLPEPPMGRCAITNVEWKSPSTHSNCKYYLNEQLEKHV
jgi:hypothetical protein